jgi:hypothetical protein
VAPPKTGKTTPPIPHITAPADVPEPEAPAPAVKGPKKRLFQKKAVQYTVLAVLVLIGAAYYFGGDTLAGLVSQKSPVATTPPAKPATPPPASAAAATNPAPSPAATPGGAPAAPGAASAPATPPANSAAVATAPATPPATLNQLAHLPKAAIDKTKATVAAHDANVRSLDPVLGDDIANKPAVAEPPGGTAPARPGAAAPAGPRTATGIVPLAPGVSATTPIEVVAEASPAFRTFVTNLPISSVLQGEPPKAMINNRLVRAGELVDATLGVYFDSVDDERRQIVFKDRTGATVARRY